MNLNEELCRKCGICCHWKIKFKDKLFIFMHKPCKYLDTNTNLCKEYANRFNLEVGCLKIEEALKQQVLPGDCPYVQEWKRERQYQDPEICN
jgi:hypothetical protein